MLIYTDLFNHEEIISDSYDLKFLFNNAGVEYDSKYIVKGGESYDIGCGNSFGGAGEDEGANDTAVKVLDVVDAFQYQQTTFGKSDFVTYVKGYMKKVKEVLDKTKPDRTADFMKGASEMVKFVLNQFSEFEFYTPSNYDTENCIIMAYYKEGNETPTFLYFIDGLKEVKC